MTVKQLKELQPWVWTGIFIQALVATVGSLYYSTFGDPVANLQAGNLLPVNNGLEPCVLCWYARILMYPILLLSYVGIAKRDKKFTDYILPLVLLGIPLEIYHYAIQKFPIATFFGCSNVNPCNALQVNYFGFMTIPLLALLGFLVLAGLIAANMYINRRLETETLVEKVTAAVKALPAKRKRISRK